MSERPRTRRPIECQVVRLLSDRDLVIDAGENEGVRRGMTFRIMGQTVIVDPDSDEIIEDYRIRKNQSKSIICRRRSVSSKNFHNHRFTCFILSQRIATAMVLNHRSEERSRLGSISCKLGTLQLRSLKISNKSTWNHMQ